MKTHTRPTVRKWLGVVGLTSLLLVAPAMIAPAAIAQGRMGGGFGMDEFARPTYGSRDVTSMVNVLGLDGDQRQLVLLFHDEYTTAHAALREEARAEMELVREDLRRARERGGDFDWRRMVDSFSTRAAAFQPKFEQVTKAFINDVKAVLSDEQMERWPEFERVHRRQTLVPQGLLSGESVDLFAVVEQVNLSQAERIAIEPSLQQYAIQLDEALRQRQADMDNAQQAVQAAIQNFDVDRALSAIERQRRLRVRIRDINESYARMIESMIAQPQEFREAYLRAAFPNVYGETDGQRIFNAALALDLPEMQRPAVEALAMQFEQRLKTLNRRIEQVIRVEEPKAAERMVRRVAAAMSRERADSTDPIRDVFQERIQLENQMIDQLHNLLTDEQRRLLPRRQRRPETGGRGGNWGIGVPGGGGGGGRGPGGGGGRGGRGGGF